MEEKEFFTLEEAALYIGIKRASMYNYMRDLHITTHKFGRDRHAYVAASDVKRMKQYREKPWGEEDTAKHKAIKPAA